MAKPWRLVGPNGNVMKVGDKVMTFREELVTLTGMEPPRYEGTTGRVYLTDDNGMENGYYPSVIVAKFVND